MILFTIIVALASAHLAKLLGSHPAAGLVVGAFFGYLLDNLAYKKFLTWKYRRFHIARLKAQAEADFLFCFFTLAGKICLSDNNICKEEEKKIDLIIKERFKLNRKDRKLAKRYFLTAERQGIAVQTLTSKLVEVLGPSSNTIENTVLMLREIALADGEVNQAEFRILFTVASVLGLDPEQSKKLINYNQKMGSSSNSTYNATGEQKPEPEKLDPNKLNYKILGCSPNDPIDKIKRSYRELAAKYHPDKIMGKDLPQDFIDFAALKFKELQGAYEFVRKDRGF